MKREFSTLIQFIVIAGLSAVYFGFLLPFKYPEISADAFDYEISIVKFWLYSFIGLSVIGFGIVSFVHRQTFADTNKSPLKLFFDEISKTSQYFLISIISVFFAFWFFLMSICGDGYSFDLISIWFGVRHSSFIWLSAFSVLILLRAGIVLTLNCLLPKRRAAEISI